MYDSYTSTVGRMYEEGGSFSTLVLIRHLRESFESNKSERAAAMRGVLPALLLIPAVSGLIIPHAACRLAISHRAPRTSYPCACEPARDERAADAEDAEEVDWSYQMDTEEMEAMEEERRTFELPPPPPSFLDPVADALKSAAAGAQEALANAAEEAKRKAQQQLDAAVESAQQQVQDAVDEVKATPGKLKDAAALAAEQAVAELLAKPDELAGRATESIDQQVRKARAEADAAKAVLDVQRYKLEKERERVANRIKE